VSAGDPKTLYIKVWNGNGTDYSTGTEGEHGLTFSCHLEDASNGWAASETHTQADEGFDYLVQGGSYPNHPVHHLSIQCGNFTAFDWAAGDRFVVEVTDVEEPFTGQSNTYTLILDGEGDQYGPDFTLGEPSPPPIEDLTVSKASERFIMLNWTAPSPGSESSAVASYLVEFDHKGPTPQGWNPTHSPTPSASIRIDSTTQASGSKEELKITGLQPGAPYYISVRYADSEGRMSSRSNIVSTATLVEFVDDDLDFSDPYIIRDPDSLFMVDNDTLLTFVWSSWEALGAASYQVSVRSPQLERTETTQDTVFIFPGEPQKTYSVEILPTSATGENLGSLQSRAILCASAILDAPGKPEIVAAE